MKQAVHKHAKSLKSPIPVPGWQAQMSWGSLMPGPQYDNHPLVLGDQKVHNVCGCPSVPIYFQHRATVTSVCPTCWAITQ